MPYVIAESCIDVMDRSCMEECPVDCIYEGGRKLYINPIAPSNASTAGPASRSARSRPSRRTARFRPTRSGSWPTTPCSSSCPCPAATRRSGAPGGAAGVGPVGADTLLVASYEDRG